MTEHPTSSEYVTCDQSQPPTRAIHPDQSATPDDHAQSRNALDRQADLAAQTFAGCTSCNLLPPPAARAPRSNERA